MFSKEDVLKDYWAKKSISYMKSSKNNFSKDDIIKNDSDIINKCFIKHSQYNYNGKVFCLI